LAPVTIRIHYNKLLRGNNSEVDSHSVGPEMSGI